MIPPGYEMLVESEDRVQATTPDRRGRSTRTLEPQEILAAMDGNIYIEPEDDGGYQAVIRREDVEEWVTDIPASARLRVDKGDRVEVGEQLTEGSKNPREVLRIQGREAVQMYLLDEVQKVYRSQGVSIHDKHIEVIIRQMLRRVRVLRSGDTDMLIGELVDRFEFEEANDGDRGAGRRAGPRRAGAAGRHQGIAEHRQLPGRGLLPGDHPRADRCGGARRQG